MELGNTTKTFEFFAMHCIKKLTSIPCDKPWGHVNLNNFFSTSNVLIVCVDMYNTKTYCYNKLIHFENHSPSTRGYLYIFCVCKCHNLALARDQGKGVAKMWAKRKPMNQRQRGRKGADQEEAWEPKAKRPQGCGPRGSLGVTSHTPGNVRKCEGV
jgi:hypothetical protein